MARISNLSDAELQSLLARAKGFAADRDPNMAAAGREIVDAVLREMGQRVAAELGASVR